MALNAPLNEYLCLYLTLSDKAGLTVFCMHNKCHADVVLSISHLQSSVRDTTPTAGGKSTRRVTIKIRSVRTGEAHGPNAGVHHHPL
jgi:hypothetical protein